MEIQYPRFTPSIAACTYGQTGGEKKKKVSCKLMFLKSVIFCNSIFFCIIVQQFKMTVCIII